MPKPYKHHSPRPLPPDAEIVDRDGKPHVRLKDRGRTVFYPLTKDRTKYLRPSKRWYFDLHGKRIKGFPDLKATEQYAAEMERKASRVRAGFIDPAEEHARRPLAEHLKDYTAALEAKGDTEKHVRDTVARCVALFTGCGFVFPLDADAGKAAEWLVNQRRDSARVELPPGRDSFRPMEAAAVLGVTKSALNRSLKREGLAAAGNGKARCIPRGSLETLAAAAARGVGPATVNHIVRAVRGFYRWLVKAKRIGSNPLESLTLLNAAVDVRRTRRELTADELRKLFAATRGSVRTFRGLTGVDRFTLYLTAAGTGFRASALANLTPADFDLNPTSPVVTLPARFNKSRKMKVQPLPADVAITLRDYLPGKPVNAPVWGGRWAKDCRAAEMLRGDLQAADIPYATDGPDGPEYADFHSLRHSFLTLGGRSGIDLRTLQELAGHSDPMLTARYSHRRLYDLQGAVGKLPNLVPDDSATFAAEKIPLRTTGTEGAAGVVPGVVIGDISLHQTASTCNLRIVDAGEGENSKPLEMPANNTDSHSVAPSRISAPSRARTEDPLIKSQLLYQLS